MTLLSGINCSADRSKSTTPPPSVSSGESFSALPLAEETRAAATTVDPEVKLQEARSSGGQILRMTLDERDRLSVKVPSSAWCDKHSVHENKSQIHLVVNLNMSAEHTGQW
jgi:hypothetical protein